MMKRQTYLDILTIFALFAIAVSNLSTDAWNDMTTINKTWDLYGWITVLTRWSMPLLISLFGILFFYRSMSFSNHTIYCKFLPQVLISCGFWWIIASLVHLKTNYANEMDFDTFLECMGQTLLPPYNIYFLQLIVMFFAFYPLLSRIVKKDNLLLYAVMTSFVVSMLFPILESIPYVRYTCLFTSQINWNFFSVYGLYLFLGIWAIKTDFAWHHRIVIYCTGALSTVAMFSLTKIFSISVSDIDSRFINDDSPFIVFQVLAIITLVKHIFRKDITNHFVKTVIKEFSKNRYAFIALYIIGFRFVNRYISEEYILLTAIGCFFFVNMTCSFFRRVPIVSYFLCDFEDVR